MWGRVVFLSFLSIHFLIGSAFGQEEDTVVVATVDSVVAAIPKKPAIIVPPFVLMNPDTIALGENDQLISDSYTAMGKPYVYDALHSFNRRKMDHFGGYLNDKINAGLAAVREQGFNSDLKQLYIQIDPSTLTVYWTAVVGPSEDGRCYTHVDSRGSAGGGLPAVQKQCPRMHHIHEDLVPVKLLEFSDNVIQCFDWYGNPLDSARNVINIRQHFYKYYNPQVGNSITLDELVKKDAERKAAAENNNGGTSIATTIPTNQTTYRKYVVRSGDSLSVIASRFNTSVSKIKKANGLRSDMIRAGQSLKIPR